MSSDSFTNCVRQRRLDRRWSQQELADCAGLPRASVSAIETGRLVPSTAAALVLARALSCRVEDLFELGDSATAEGPAWAWEGSGAAPRRYWLADCGGRRLLYPAEATRGKAFAHDGVVRGETLDQRCDAPPPTIVMACCDPAVGILSTEISRSTGIRLLTFFRSSRAVLRLLKQGVVHVAGLHLEHPGGGGNAAAVAELGEGYRLIHAAQWEEGVITAGDAPSATLRGLVRSRPRWWGARLVRVRGSASTRYWKAKQRREGRPAIMQALRRPCAAAGRTRAFARGLSPKSRG